MMMGFVKRMLMRAPSFASLRLGRVVTLPGSQKIWVSLLLGNLFVREPVSWD